MKLLERSNFTILAIVALALALRLVIVLQFKERDYPVVKANVQPEPEVVYLKRGEMELGDSQQYWLLAKNLRERGRFSWNTEPVAFRTPGYPVFLALLGNNLTLTVVVQAVLSSLTVALLVLLGRKLFSGWVGLVAGLCLTFDISSILYSGVIMSETLFLPCLVAATYLFFVRREWASGFLLGAAVLIRPIAVGAFLPFAVMLIIRKSWRRLALFLTLVALLPGLWMSRNFLIFKRFGLTSVSGSNLLYCNAGSLVAAQRRVSPAEARLALAREFGSKIASTNPLEISAVMTRKAVQIIAHDPGRYLFVTVGALAKVIAGVKVDDLVLRLIGSDKRLAVLSEVMSGKTNNFPWIITIILVLWELIVVFATLVLSLLGIILRPGRGTRLLLLAVGWYLLFAATPLTDARFRLPAMPFFYLCAASSLRPGLDRWRSRNILCQKPVLTL
ncbi:MAG: glycosyltransferase family 39 protein [candidate division WOR-3 bacterium]